MAAPFDVVAVLWQSCGRLTVGDESQVRYDCLMQRWLAQLYERGV